MLIPSIPFLADPMLALFAFPDTDYPDTKPD